MNIDTIKQLAVNIDANALTQAHNDLINEESPSINIPGDDPGEQLTHIIGALWVQREMNTNHVTITTAVRRYISMVRSTIQ